LAYPHNNKTHGDGARVPENGGGVADQGWLNMGEPRVADLQYESKSNPFPKTFCSIFTQAKYIFVNS